MSSSSSKVPESNAVYAGKRFLLRQSGWWVVIAGCTAAMYAIAWPLAAAYGGFLVVYVGTRKIGVSKQAKRFNAAYNEAVAALGRGDLRTAHQILWEWAEGTKLPGASAIARLGLAWTLMRQRELQNAVDVLLDNDVRNEWVLKKIGLFPTSAIHLALYYSLLGDEAAAEKWFQTAETRVTDVTTPAFRAMKAFVRAVLDCRAGRAAEAARALDECWAQYEAALTGDTLRPLRVVRAFAIASANSRDIGKAESIVSSVRPAYPGEYDFLGTAWPEMAAFLTTHEL